jgi:hypothetical protein
MAKTAYQRLTRARGMFAVAVRSRTSLWLGEDHLLFVDSSGYTETYKRFYFRDIQTVLFQQTKRGLAWNIILGTVAAVVLIILLATKPAGSFAQWTAGEITGGIFLGGIAGIFALLLLVNVFRGATCKTFLRTAVQIEELPSLCRVRQTRKVLAKIRPHIAAAQGGELTPQTISEQLREPANAPKSDAENSRLPANPDS